MLPSLAPDRRGHRSEGNGGTTSGQALLYQVARKSSKAGGNSPGDLARVLVQLRFGHLVDAEQGAVELVEAVGLADVGLETRYDALLYARRALD